MREKKGRTSSWAHTQTFKTAYQIGPEPSQWAQKGSYTKQSLSTLLGSVTWATRPVRPLGPKLGLLSRPYDWHGSAEPRHEPAPFGWLLLGLDTEGWASWLGVGEEDRVIQDLKHPYQDVPLLSHDKSTQVVPVVIPS